MVLPGAALTGIVGHGAGAAEPQATLCERRPDPDQEVGELPDHGGDRPAERRLLRGLR
jgi:hypothetical protein